MKVEVAYALPDSQTVLALDVDEPCTVAQAIHQSGILEQHADIDLSVNKVGIYSKPAALEQTLKPFDRIEIYRPLQVDPKAARKGRAK